MKLILLAAVCLGIAGCGSHSDTVTVNQGDSGNKPWPVYLVTATPGEKP